MVGHTVLLWDCQAGCASRPLCMCHLYSWLGICFCVKPARAAGSQQTHVYTYTPGSSNHAHQLSRALQRLLLSIVVCILPAYHFMLFHSWQGMDLSQGIAAVVPDWDSVRLLAPHAELRLLACGQASLIAPHRLRSPIVCPSMHLLSDNDYCHCLSSNTLLLLWNGICQCLLINICFPQSLACYRLSEPTNFVSDSGICHL